MSLYAPRQLIVEKAFCDLGYSCWFTVFCRGNWGIALAMRSLSQVVSAQCSVLSAQLIKVTLLRTCDRLVAVILPRLREFTSS